MKRSFLVIITSLFVTVFTAKTVHAQDNNPDSATIVNDALKESAQEREIQDKENKKPKENRFSKFDLTKRPHDHLIIGYGVAGLSGTNDTTSTHGFSRQFEIEMMFDKPIKTNPHLSVGYGLGLMSTNLFFSNKYINLATSTNSVDFSTTKKFNKFKLVLNYIEIPVEFRYAKNIEQPQKGFKFAIGFKAGYLLSAYSKGKNEINSSGASLYGTGYVEKQRNSRFFNSTMLSGTARVGFGAFSIFGNYSILSMFKSDAGPTLRPYAIGFAVSGL